MEVKYLNEININQSIIENECSRSVLWMYKVLGMKYDLSLSLVLSCWYEQSISSSSQFTHLYETTYGVVFLHSSKNQMKTQRV